MKRYTNAAPKNIDDTSTESTVSPIEPVKLARKPSVRKAVPQPLAGPVYFTTAEAAADSNCACRSGHNGPCELSRTAGESR